MVELRAVAWQWQMVAQAVAQQGGMRQLLVQMESLTLTEVSWKHASWARILKVELKDRSYVGVSKFVRIISFMSTNEVGKTIVTLSYLCYPT